MRDQSITLKKEKEKELFNSTWAHIIPSTILSLHKSYDIYHIKCHKNFTDYENCSKFVFGNVISIISKSAKTLHAC